MTSVTLDKSIATDLIDTKLGLIRNRIDEILIQWNVIDPQKFIKDVEAGKYSEAEMDALRLTNLLDALKEYEQLQSNIQRQE